MAGIVSTFTVLTLARVFFRSDSVNQALAILSKIFSISLFEKPLVSRLMLVLLALYMLLEWLQKDKKHLLDITFIKYKQIRW